MVHKSPTQLQREIDDKLSQTESKKERSTRLVKALRAARSLESEARNARDYLNPRWDGAEIMVLADEAVQTAEALLSAIAALKAEE